MVRARRRNGCFRRDEERETWSRHHRLLCATAPMGRKERMRRRQRK
jgi:hypothetical protein